MHSLFEKNESTYQPRPAALFNPSRIILAKGATSTPEASKLTEGICCAYPNAEVVEQLAVPHNKIDLNQQGLLETHHTGKQTLVLAIHQSAVRRSEESDNTCPNFWHFSPYGFCPYQCHYCYLAGTQGVRFSPTVKIYLNLEQILSAIDTTASRLDKPTAFYLGKLQDGLALDPLTGYSRRIIPFFANHAFARMTLLTKSVDVDNLLDLDHGNHSFLSWTINPHEVKKSFEPNTPSIAARIQAMAKCAATGYPVRAVIMPMIPIDNWKEVYAQLLDQILSQVELNRITLGGICSFAPALNLMEQKLTSRNVISKSLDTISTVGDSRKRYPVSLRVEMYKALISIIRKHQPGVDVGLCMEEQVVFEQLAMNDAIGCCNCVL